jgi:hypothetical protein
MDRKMILYVLGFALFGFVGIMLLLPKEVDDGVMRLPWVVSVDSQGRTQVFGFTLGETTLGEVRRVFDDEGKLNLFADPEEGAYVVEAFFDQVWLNRLRGDFVLTLDADQPLLAPMYERGLRISQLGSGAKRVTLAPEDIERLLNAPIASITYLPWKSLDDDIIERRFGTPTRKLTEPGTGVVHWLYPDRGFDVAIDRKGGVVVQYVNPADFPALIAPLEETEKAPAAAAM